MKLFYFFISKNESSFSSGVWNVTVVFFRKGFSLKTLVVVLNSKPTFRKALLHHIFVGSIKG
jgi:hypothetical protein